MVYKMGLFITSKSNTIIDISVITDCVAGVCCKPLSTQLNNVENYLFLM